MPMPNRQIVGGEPYRYAFQGQEKDPETGKEAFQLRLWDGRIGRWLTTDPERIHPSPYVGMGNNPTVFKDRKGDSIYYYDKDLKSVRGLTMSGGMKDVIATVIGADLIKKYVNSRYRHIHIAWADLRNYQVDGEKVPVHGVTLTSSSESWRTKGFVDGTGHGMSEYSESRKIDPFYLAGFKFESGRNQIILLNEYSLKTTSGLAKTIFHEIKAHVDFYRIHKDEHNAFSGDPNGHFNPETLKPPYGIDVFPLNVFLRQLGQVYKGRKVIKRLSGYKGLAD
jgi:RHS repeat-associated protein